MKQITPAEFLAKVESGDITAVFGRWSTGEKLGGIDSSYDFDRAEAGKINELVWCIIP